MEIAKLTSKGQLTLPISIRRQLNLEAGDKVAFVERDGELIVARADSLTIAKRKPSIDSVIASMEIEGLDIDGETLQYMRDRLAGKVDIDKRISELNAKYKKV